MNKPDSYDRSYERVYSVALLRLNKLIDTGLDEEAEGDAVRDEMDMHWYRMDDRQRERMDYLSVDLEDLAQAKNKSDHAGPIDRKWAEEMQSVRDVAGAEGADRILALLRDPRSGKISANIAFIQARNYERLGLPEAALRFYEFAEARDGSLKAMTLHSLTQLGWMDLALPRAENLICERRHDPVAMYYACLTLLESARFINPLSAKPTLMRIRDLLTPCVVELEKSNSDDPNRTDIYPASVLILGLCLDRLGQYKPVVRVCDKYLNANTGIAFADAEIYHLRGSAKVAMDDQGAMEDFRKSIQLKTESPWPYLFLVSNSLQRGDLKYANELCNNALNYLPAIPPICRALLLEGRAIVMDRLGQPKKSVLATFDLAIELSPEDARLKRNRDIAASGTGFDLTELTVASPIMRINQLQLMKYSDSPFANRIARQAFEMIEGITIPSAA